MEYEVGSILTGKVTGITKFGAFVQIAPGKSGLVHISEVANTFVSDVHDFLTEGQEVQVKLIRVDENGRLNLSVKQALPKEERPAHPAAQKRENTPLTPAPREPARSAVSAHPRRLDPSEMNGEPLADSGNAAFEDKLKKFMQDSDSKMSGIKIYAENKRSNRRRK